jgi:hypothetical protein
MSTHVVGQRFVEVLGKLGETDACDRECNPGGENDERTGPDSLCSGCRVAGETRFPGPLSESAGYKTEMNQGREMSFVLVVE